MLRESCELNSAEVAVVHCGERVLLLQEAMLNCKVLPSCLGKSQSYLPSREVAMRRCRLGGVQGFAPWMASLDGFRCILPHASRFNSRGK